MTDGPYRKGSRVLLALFATALPAAGSPTGRPPTTPERSLSLAGEWRFRLDPDGVGLEQGWASQRLPDRIRLPGSTDEQGYGHRTIGAAVGRLTRVYEYVGPAWYQREVTIPPEWRGKRITLFLERCHWETQVFVDGSEAGVQNSLIAPHVYDLTRLLAPGGHRLTIRVDNTVKIDIGGWGHSITDETQTNWNGIIGRIELQATDPVWIDSLNLFPDVSRRTVLVKATIGNATGERASRVLTLEASPGDGPSTGPIATGKARFDASTRTTQVQAELRMGGSALPWDEFSPNLYELRASLSARAGSRDVADERAVTFGLREFGNSGMHFTVNGRPTFLRGTLECAIFPLTGYPPTNVEPWLRIFGIARSYGLNHFRFHSWCPPEAAFAAADETGFMLQVAAPLWIGGGNVGGDPARAAFIQAEADRILETYGNHPSFCMMSMGNELGSGGEPFLQDLVEHCRRKDPRHLYTCTSHPYGAGRDDDYFVSASGPGGALRGAGRLNAERPRTDYDYQAAIVGVDRPIVAHELGQWAMYANLDEARKYTGVLRARNFEAYRESLAEHGMLDEAEAFRRASGAFMVLLYKEEIETALRTPHLAGFQLLDVHDFPGQGTALVGMLDPFWDSKGLITPEAFRRYCAASVPLLRMAKRVWTTDETFEAAAEVAHYGRGALARCEPRWRIEDERGRTVARGGFGSTTIPVGGVTTLGRIAVPLKQFAAPGRYVVTVSPERNHLQNAWSFWVYPARVEALAPRGVRIATAWDDDARRMLANGVRVVLLPPTDWLRNAVPGSFTPVFWCVRLFPSQPGTMGILCDPRHPALARFPTESHSDWQWWDLLTRSKALVLDETPPDFRPIVQVIDNFDRNHKLGAVFEARVGAGRLLVSTIDLVSDLDERPAARQLRYSLLAYAASDRFRPKGDLSISLLDRLFEPSPLYKLRGSPTPEDVGRAVLDVKAAVHVPPRQSQPWRPEHDEVISRAAGFGYSVSGGTWLDDVGSAWHDPHLAVTITCPRGFEGTLYAHFHDWNNLNRAAVISFNGAEIGTLGDHAGDGFWLRLPVTARDSAQGRLELSARTTAGPNTMITQIVLVPK
jgi:hypothetical protein